MKKFLFLMTPRQRRKADESDAFVTLLQQHDIAVTLGNYGQLSYFVTSDDRSVWFNGRDLAEFDAVYFRGLTDNRGLAATAAFYLQEKDVPFVDQEVAGNQSFNKLQQMSMLSRAGVRVPVTFFGGAEQLQRLVSGGRLRFPFVVKGKVASRGRDNYLVHTSEELTEATTAKGEAFFIVQQAIPNEGDYRVVVLGGKARFAMYRQRQTEGSHLNNTSQGALATEVSIADGPLAPIVADIEKAARVFGRDVAGVDIIIDSTTGQYAILEVNRAPQLTNGAFVPQKMAALAEYLHSL